MRSARLAAQKAYDELTSDQKAQIDSALVSKLDDSPLSTTFKDTTLTLTPGEGAYTDTQICHCANYAHHGDDLMKNGQVFPLHAFTPFKKHHTQAKKERKYFITAEESCQRH